MDAALRFVLWDVKQRLACLHGRSKFPRSGAWYTTSRHSDAIISSMIDGLNPLLVRTQAQSLQNELRQRDRRLQLADVNRKKNEVRGLMTWLLFPMYTIRYRCCKLGADK